jgi:hypothetical protein
VIQADEEASHLAFRPVLNAVLAAILTEDGHRGPRCPEGSLAVEHDKVRTLPI